MFTALVLNAQTGMKMEVMPTGCSRGIPFQNHAGFGYIGYTLNPPLETNHTGINADYFQKITDHLLGTFYPVSCAHCQKPMTGRIKTRPYAIKCTHCKTHRSVLSATPFVHLRLPQWMIGWLLNESIVRAPAVVTATYIHKTLGITHSSALRLKRRVQVMASEYAPQIRALMSEELTARYGKIKGLPEKDPNNIDQDVTRYMRDKRIPQADTVVLYSTQNTANKGRKRFRAHGQTASIYRADSLGGDQVGTLVNTITWRGGPAVYDSIPNQRGETLLPLLDRVIPRNTPLFTDEGYRWYRPHNQNHRTVNHNLKARRGTGKSRRRWQQNHVHCQAAEARNGVLKGAFRQYRYIRPQFSQLYLNEHSFIGALRYWGVERVAGVAGQTLAPEGWGQSGIDFNTHNPKKTPLATD